MRTARFHDLELSALMLGTVQFGLDYGIANRDGQPAYETARDILACAHEGGVNCLDTAAAYGSSEEVLGKALAELGIAGHMTIASKVPPIPAGLHTGTEIDEFVESQVVASLRRLRLDCLPICLLHREEDSPHIGSLLKLKKRGLIRHVGVSVYSTKAAELSIASGSVHALQIPASALDQRFMRRGVCEAAKAKRIGLFARSIYLQGLLLMPESDIPTHLATAIPVRRPLQEIADQAGITLMELAARYVLSLPGLTCALVGVCNVPQMRENLAVFARGPLESALVQAVEGAVPDLSEDVLLPNRWPR